MHKYKICYSGGAEPITETELYDLNRLNNMDFMDEWQSIDLNIIKKTLKVKISEGNFDRVSYDNNLRYTNPELQTLLNRFNSTLDLFNSQKDLIDNNFSFIEKFLKKNNINIEVNYMNIPLILNELNNKIEYIKVNCDGNNDFYQILENDLNETYINQILERLVNIVKLFGTELLQVMDVEIIDVTAFGLLDKIGKINYLKTTCSKVSSYINEIVTSFTYYNEILNILVI